MKKGLFRTACRHSKVKKVTITTENEFGHKFSFIRKTCATKCKGFLGDKLISMAASTRS